jgi:hypothetical protein
LNEAPLLAMRTSASLEHGGIVRKTCQAMPRLSQARSLKE